MRTRVPESVHAAIPIAVPASAGRFARLDTSDDALFFSMYLSKNRLRKYLRKMR